MAEERASLAEKENVLIPAVVLRQDDCVVTILRDFGGKISSICVGGRELLQSPLAQIAPRTHTQAFDESDASGWDECLPSVAACTLQTANGTAQIPDHGDVWRVKWQVSPSQEIATTATLTAKCFSLPLELERRIQLSHRNGGWRIRARYEVKNIGSHEVPWSWAAHPLFAVERGDRIVLPESIRTLKVEGSAGSRLGSAGATIAWPRAVLKDGSTADLSSVADTHSGVGDKLFAGPLNPDEHWCALERPSVGLRIRVSFDTKATPYLGLWICCGGWPEKPGPKQVCVAMEPATAPVDSLAVAGPWSRHLAPGESFAWPMEVEIERIER